MDNYTQAASEIFLVKPEEVTKEMRDHVKALAFYYMYSAGPKTMKEYCDANNIKI